MNNKNEPTVASSVLNTVASEIGNIVTAAELQDNNDKPIEELLNGQKQETNEQGDRS